MNKKRKIYVDESGNNGPIEYDFEKDRLNYDQRYFSLCFFIPKEDDQYYIEKYGKFKKKYLGNEDNVIKGTTLMTRDYNEALEIFIKEFINDEEFYVNLYDKKFLMITHMAYCVFGAGHRIEAPIAHYLYIDILINQKDSYFRKFFEVIQSCNQDKTKELIKYMIEYDYEIQTQEQQENLIWMRELLKFYIKEEKAIELITEELSDYRGNALISPNLQALGENILVLKDENKNLKNKDIEFIHDRNSFVEKYLSDFLPNLNISFENNKENIMLQIADNVASILNKLQKEILSRKYYIIPKIRKCWHFKQFRNISARLGTSNIKYCLDVITGSYLRAYAYFDDDMSNLECILYVKYAIDEFFKSLTEINWNIFDAYDEAIK